MKALLAFGFLVGSAAALVGLSRATLLREQISCALLAVALIAAFALITQEDK